MDLSKEYIKMCDCPEIQDGWEPTRGDNYILGDAMPNNKHFAVIVLGCCWEKCSGCRYEVEDLKAECIWIPRQDQLQEMYCSIPKDGKHQKEAPSYLACCNVLCEEIYEFSKKDCEMGLQSMEQLWLAFVMWELYQKRWDGEKWIKEESDETT